MVFYDLEELGLSLRPNDRGEGVVIEDVDGESDAAEKGLRQGDVIVEVNSRKVSKPSDIDAAALHGLGFPRILGGPMEAADQAGLLPLRNRLRALAAAAADAEATFWSPPPLLDELIKNGRLFDSLNG